MKLQFIKAFNDMIKQSPGYILQKICLVKGLGYEDKKEILKIYQTTCLDIHQSVRKYLQEGRIK